MKPSIIGLGIPSLLVLIVDKANDLHVRTMPVLQKTVGGKKEWPLLGRLLLRVLFCHPSKKHPP